MVNLQIKSTRATTSKHKAVLFKPTITLVMVELFSTLATVRIQTWHICMVSLRTINLNFFCRWPTICDGWQRRCPSESRPQPVSSKPKRIKFQSSVFTTSNRCSFKLLQSINEPEAIRKYRLGTVVRRGQSESAYRPKRFLASA